jgi:hypothetical protein
MNPAQRSRHKSIATLLIVFIMAIWVLAAQTYILTAIEKAETYSGTCMALDRDCSIGSDHRVHLEDHPSGELNLAYHLMGSLVAAPENPLGSLSLSDALLPYRSSLPLWIFATLIFHPPKS